MEAEKLLSNYCSNLNKIVDYLKGKSTDLKSLDDLRLDQDFGGRISEVNVNLELMRNVERIKGSEVLASIKSKIHESGLDEADFGSSLMRETLKSNKLRRDHGDLMKEVEELKKLHKYEPETLEKFIDVVQSKIAPRSQGETYDLKSFASKPVKMEDSIELLLIKRLAILEKNLPESLDEAFKQAKHTLGTVMIDYLNKIEGLDLLVLSGKEQNESLKGKMDSLMNEVRSRRKVEALGQERYLHLCELLSRQQEISKKEIRNLQEKLEEARAQAELRVDDWLTDYELVTSDDTLEYVAKSPLKGIQNDENVSGRRQETPSKFEELGFDSYISEDFTPLQMPPMASGEFESRDEKGNYRRPAKPKSKPNYVQQMRLPVRLGTIDSEPEEITETPRNQPKPKTQDSTDNRNSENKNTLPENFQKSEILVGESTPSKKINEIQEEEIPKQIIRLSPEQLLGRVRQLEAERAKGLMWISKLDTRNRYLERKAQALAQEADHLRSREDGLISAYQKFCDKNKISDQAEDPANFPKAFDGILKEYEQLKVNDKSGLSELQSELQKAKQVLDRVYSDAKYFRDLCLVKDAQLRKLYLLTQDNSNKKDKEETIEAISKGSPGKKGKGKETSQASPQKIEKEKQQAVKEEDVVGKPTDSSRADRYSDTNYEQATKSKLYYYPERSQKIWLSKGVNQTQQDLDSQLIIEDLRSRLVEITLERDQLVDDRSRLISKMKATDRLLEELADKNKDREVPFIFVMGRPTTAAQVTDLLTASEEQVDKKTLEVDSWHRGYIKLENLCNSLQRENRRLRQRLNDGGSEPAMEKGAGIDPQESSISPKNIQQTKSTLTQGTNAEYQSKGPVDKQQRSIEDLRSQLLQVKREKATLEEDLLAITNRCKAVDKILEDVLHGNKEKELPFIYVKGKPTTGDQIFSMLETSSEILQKKDNELEKWQKDYLELENFCDQLERENFALKRKAIEGQKLQEGDQLNIDNSLIESSTVRPVRRKEVTESNLQSATSQSNVVDRSQLTSLEAKISELNKQNQTLEAQKQALESQKKALETQKSVLESQKQSVEAQKSLLESQKAASDSERIGLINRLAGSSNVQEGLTKQLRSYEDTIASLRIQLDAGQERCKQLNLELAEIKKEIASQKAVNAQLVAASEKSMLLRREQSPLQMARAHLAQNPQEGDFEVMEDDTLEQLVVTVGKENEELKEKVRNLELSNASLIQEKELYSATAKGKDSKIAELTSECNHKEAQIKNLVDQYNRSTTQLSEIQNAMAALTPKKTTNIGIQTDLLEDHSVELKAANEKSIEDSQLILELQATIVELKEELEAQNHTLEELRKTFARVCAKKQLLVNLVLSLDEDIYIGGRPLCGLDENTLDALMEESLSNRRPQIQKPQTRTANTTATTATLNVVNIKPPVLEQDRHSPSAAAPIVDSEALSKLNKEVNRLGEDNRKLKAAVQNYVEREESLKGHMLATLDALEEANPDTKEDFSRFREALSHLDDDMDDHLEPLDYSAVFEFLSFLANFHKQSSALEREIQAQNTQVFQYQNPPEPEDNELLLQILKRNEEHQRQLRELLVEKINHNRSILERGQALSSDTRSDSLKTVTEALASFTNR